MIPATMMHIRPAHLYICVALLAMGTSCQDSEPQSETKAPEQQETPADLQTINQTILDDANDPDLYIERSKIHQRNLDFESAMKDIERAMAIDSTRADFFYEQGALLFANGQVPQAKEVLSHAISLDEGDPAPKLLLAEVHFVLKEHDRSMRRANDVLRLDDQLPKAYFIKGMIYREKGNPALAKSSFQTVTELDPDNVEAFNLLGMTYAAEDDPLALQYYESGLAVDSTNRELLYNRAYYFQDQLQLDDALWGYDQLLRHHPDAAVAHHNKGYIYLGLLSDPKLAVDAFTEAIRLHPEYTEAYSNRGVALEELGKLDQAEADFQRALELNPNFQPAVDGLNRIH